MMKDDYYYAPYMKPELKTRKTEKKGVNLILEEIIKNYERNCKNKSNK